VNYFIHTKIKLGKIAFSLSIWILVLCIGFSKYSVAQEEQTDLLLKSDTVSQLIQLSGMIISNSDLDPLPYTTVYDKTLGRGVMADYHGYFSMVTVPGDTLYFSFYGHQTSTYIVPDSLTDNRYSIIHMMLKDTINLPEMTIYPWPSREDFARYFVEVSPTDDALRRAQRELSGESLAFVAARIKTDASLSHKFAQNQLYTQLYNKGTIPTFDFLNPGAWIQFFQAWKDGKLKRE